MMKYLLKIAASLVLIGTAGSFAAAEERPVLRSQVMTLSEIVTIGDFYSNAGTLAPTPLFRSPDLGTSGNVPAETVAKRARAAGLTMASTDGLRSVVVHRGATRLDRDQIAGLVRKALSERSAGIDPQNLEVRLLQSPDQVLADPKVKDPIRIDRVEWSQTSGRFSVFATVAVEHGTAPLTLTGIAEEMVEVIALAQPLRRGDILSENDVIQVRLARKKVPAGALADPAAVVGKEARTNLRANAPIARKDFQRPILIEKREKITVIFEMPGMKLTSRAIAMDEGAKGDVIDIMNMQSRRIVPATVVSRGRVKVHSANPIVASLNSETN
ncbi:MAG: flagellar basal body P-ring formation protein FlgA [Roseibium sp.]|nr:flagellar basal body P-ring formation protein FlgA [Roseibium sp.]MBO6932207.1 flagellar basal body P-ring formation protein FlgA [Roseibium sp.]